MASPTGSVRFNQTFEIKQFLNEISRREAEAVLQEEVSMKIKSCFELKLPLPPSAALIEEIAGNLAAVSAANSAEVPVALNVDDILNNPLSFVQALRQ